MESNKTNLKDSIFFVWSENLVGTANKFSFNLLISVIGGFLYTFSYLPSLYVLVIFGVLSPLIFTLCIYFLVRLMANNPESPFPKIFSSSSSSMMLMLFDMAIIIGMALLIHSQVIDYLLFRLLQTLILPLLLLFILRMLFVHIQHNPNDE